MSSMTGIYHGKRLSLYKKKIRMPNGYMATVELLKHPGAVVIAPFLSKDRLILLRQYRPVLEDYLYEFPAGTIDPGENTLVCAKREMVEETGFKGARFTKVGEIYPVPGYSTEKITVYKAGGLTKVEFLPQRDEVIEPLHMDVKRLRRIFREGGIIDAKTICAMAFCGII